VIYEGRIQMSTYTIGINVFNEEKNLPRLLAVLLAETDFPIILYNDGSTDRSKDILFELFEKTDRITIIDSQENKGYAVGFMSLVKACPSEILIMMDADTYPKPGAIKELLKPFHDPRVGAVSGAHIVLEGNSRVLNLVNLRIIQAKRRLDSIRSSRGEFTHMNGLLMAFRVKTLRDNKYMGCNQDAFIGWLIHQNGYRVVFNPRAESWFKPPATLKEYLSSRDRILMGHMNLSLDWGIREYFWAYGSLSEYVYSILMAGRLNLPGILSLLFASWVDLFYRLKWWNKVRAHPRVYTSLKWEQLASTKF